MYFNIFNTLSGRLGKVVASHAEGWKVDLIYTMHQPLKAYCHEGGGATSQLDLSSLTPLFIAGCDRL